MTGPVFRFRLERVRAVRERKEKLAQQALAAALSRRTGAEQGLRVADAEIEHALAEQRTAVVDTAAVSGDELLSRQAFLERLEAQRGAQVDELAQRDVEVADRGAKLTSAAADHEMLNRLRERRRGEHDRELALREGNALDEIATNRYRRRTA